MKLYKGRMMFFCCLLNLCILIFQSDIHGYKLFKQVAWNSSLDIKMNMPVPIKSLLVCTVHCKLFPECSMLAFNESLNQCMVETNTPHRTLTAGWNLYMALGCPDEWEPGPYNTSCYFFSIEKQNWDHAQAACRDMGAELVTINSEDENNYIIDKAKIMDSDFWLGANDRVQEGTFVWGDSSDPVIIHNWFYYEPNGGTNENCVYITKTLNFYWGDLQCSTSLPYVCERALSDCPLGWVIPENMTSTSCYLFSTDSKNWESAQIECHNNGADLVVINSKEEMLYIKEQAKDRNSHLWLGANDRLNEGIFVWGDSNETLSVADWRAYFPDGGTVENCIYISKTFFFNWFDIKCSNSNPFICKQGFK